MDGVEEANPPSLNEISELLAALAASNSMQRIRPASLWALKIALAAAMTEGLCGEITITIPQKGNVPVEASFRTGRLG